MLGVLYSDVDMLGLKRCMFIGGQILTSCSRACKIRSLAAQVEEEEMLSETNNAE